MTFYNLFLVSSGDKVPVPTTVPSENVQTPEQELTEEEFFDATESLNDLDASLTDSMVIIDPSSSETVQQTHSYVPGIFSTIGNAIYNAPTAIGKVYAAAPEMALNAFLTTGAAKMTLQLATYGFDYETEASKHKQFLNEKTGSDKLYDIVLDLEPPITEIIKDKIWKLDPSQAIPLLDLISSKPNFLCEFTKVVLFRILHQVIEKAYKDWEAANKQPPTFISFLFESMIILYKSFEEKSQEVLTYPQEQRKAKWNELVGAPLVKLIIEKYLPNPESIITETTGIAWITRKIFNNFALPAISSYLTDYLAQGKEFIHNSARPRIVQQDKEYIESLEGGIVLMGDIEALVKGLMNQSPQVVKKFIAPHYSKIAADFLAKSSSKDASYFQKWILDSLEEVYKVDGNGIQIGVKETKEQLTSILIQGVANVLRKNPPQEGSTAAKTIFDALSREVNKFFTQTNTQADLLAFEETLKTMDEAQKAAAIKEKYAPFYNALLKLMDLQDNELVKKVDVQKFIAPYLRAIFLTVTVPTLKKDELIQTVLTKVTGAADDANKEFAQMTSATLSNFITVSVQEQIRHPANQGKIFVAIEEKLGKPLDEPTKNQIKKSLNWLAQNETLDNRDLIWKKVELLIQTALLYGTDKLLDKSGHSIHDVVTLLANSLNQFGPEIEGPRLAESQNHKRNLEAIRARGNNFNELKKELTRHSNEVQNIYRPYVEQLMKDVLNSDDLHALTNLLPAELKEHGEMIWDMVWKEILPETIAGMHEKTMSLADDRINLRDKVEASYNSKAPVKFARVTAEYIKAYLPQYLDKNLKSQGRGPRVPNQSYVAEKIVDGIASFLQGKGRKVTPLGTERLGDLAARYIQDHQAELAKELAQEMLLTGTNASVALSNGMNVGVDLIEGLLLKVLHGLNENIKERENDNAEVMPEFVSDIFKAVNERLAFANDPSKVPEPEPQGPQRSNADRILNSVGITRENSPLPDELKDTVWESLNDSVLPSALSTVVETVVNKKMLRKLLKSALEGKKASSIKAKKTEKAHEEAYAKAKEEAMLSGKPIPEYVPITEPKHPKKSDDRQRVENTIALQISGILNEVAVASEEPIFKWFMRENIADARESVAVSAAEALYDELEKGKTTGILNSCFAEAMNSMDLAKVVDGKLKNIQVRFDEATGELIDIETNEAVNELKFNIVEPTKKEEDFDKEVDKTLDELACSIVREDIVLAPVKSWLKDAWFKFQQVLDNIFNTVLPWGIGGTIKIWLDKVSLFLFRYTIGLVLRAMMKAFEKMLDLYISHKKENLFKKLDETYNENLANDVGNAAMKHLEKKRLRPAV